MNPYKKLNKKQIKFIENVTQEIIEDREYTNEEINIYKRKILEYGMSESTKNGEMDRIINEFSTIVNSL